jgi:beta-N-acetylhexosaminidase
MVIMIFRYKFVFAAIFLIIFDKSYSQVSLEAKIGQMIMTGFSGTTATDSLKYDLKYRNQGGVALYAANITNPNQLKILTTQLSSFSTEPLFIGVDQEGGKVARLGVNNGYSASNSAYRLGTIINREDSTRQTALMMANWLKTGGINFNFAPVVDVNVNPTNPVIGALERSFSANPITVASHARWFRDEFHKRGIFTALKHFPGHGSSQTDSHLGFTDITSTWSDMELIPYKSLIASGDVDLIMVGHLFNRNLDTSFPASLSQKVITNLLRDSLKFNGVVISDELFMKAISDNFTFDYAIELCIKSGTDIMLFSTDIYNKRSLTGYLIETISAKVRLGVIPEQLINNAYDRIMNLKKRLVSSIQYISQSSQDEDIRVSNYPNPFNAESTIKYNLPKTGMVRIIVYDALGREVTTLVDAITEKGEHSVKFNSGNYSLSSGVYFYQIKSDYGYKIGKMLLLR